MLRSLVATELRPSLERHRSVHANASRVDTHRLLVNLDQATRIAVAFACQTATTQRSGLGAVCTGVLSVAGAGVSLMASGRSGTVSISDAYVGTLEDVQFAIGVGPSHDAFASGRPVLTPCFDDRASSRWPSFVDLARANGVAAVFAYPLGFNGASIGVLSLYQPADGNLTMSQHDDSVAMAEMITETLLTMQDTAPDGMLAAGLEDAVSYRAQVYQASGMVAVQLRIPVSDALLRMRAHAFATGASVGFVAADIVARRLRLDDDAKGSRNGLVAGTRE